jgi:hypothetical protein
MVAGECSSVSELCPGQQSYRLPSGLRGSQTVPRNSPAWYQELGDGIHHRLFWAQSGLLRGKDPTMGPEQVHQS